MLENKYLVLPTQIYVLTSERKSEMIQHLLAILTYGGTIILVYMYYLLLVLFFILFTLLLN